MVKVTPDNLNTLIPPPPKKRRRQGAGPRYGPNSRDSRGAWTESAIQCQFVLWLRKQEPQPLFTATLGGADHSIHKLTRNKREGYSAGVPDLIIFEPRYGHHGLAIEVKKPKSGVVDDAQWRWKAALEERGYVARICYGLQECIHAYLAYTHGDAGSGE